MSHEILKPQKRDTVLLNEKLSNTNNTDEVGIEESNKRLLSRQIKPNINLIENNKTKIFITNKKSKNFKTAEKMRLKQPKFKSPERIQKVKKINLNKINFIETTEKKNFPEDNLRGSLLAKTQAREYERKVIYIGDNVLQSENRTKKKRIVINTNGINNNDIAFGKNGQIKPTYLFTDSKKNDFFEKREFARSPVVQKIDFLKTVFDDNENY